ncbi:unnamed protein product [Diamesa serratosioi]
MKFPNSILIFSSIVCLSLSLETPINTKEVKTNTKSVSYNQQCNNQLSYFDNALLTREPWALEFFGTWTKFQPRHKVDYGDFDHCVQFRLESKDAGLVQGQHCLITYKEISSNTENTILIGGICLPASCTPNEVLAYANESLRKNNLFVLTVGDQGSFCHTNNKITFSVIDFIAIIVLSFFGILLLLSTSYDIYKKTQKRKPHELYVAFSVLTNCRKLFDFRKSEDPNSIHCLHGLRALSILWIMFGHRYVLTTLTPIVNPAAYSTWLETIFSAIVNSHPMAVETFLVISGLLLTWTLMKNLDSGNFRVLKMYLHRYLRLTPVFAILVLFVVSLYRHIGSGPYKTVNYNNYAVPCEKYWWSALLHIQNYVNPQQICLLNSWYLSIDFQLTLLSPIIVYPAWKYGWKFLWTLPVFITLTEFCTLMISLKYDLKGFKDLNSQDLIKIYNRMIYYPTHIRMGAWLVGVMVGYQLYKIRNKKTVINKTVDIVMWILSIGTFVAIVIGLYPLQQKEHIDKRYGHAFYLAFTRNNFAYALSWIICACHVGTGGIVRWFLSLQLWKPLDKLGLSFYLVHAIIQSIVPVKQPLYFNDINVLYTCLGDFMISFFFAMILYLTFEAPIMILEKYIYKNQEDWIRRLKL